MAKYFKQDCSLCDNTAEYCKVDAGNVKYFNCTKCGMFQISQRAERLLADEFPNRKSEYSTQVKATPADHLLFIRMPSPEFRQRSDDALQAEYTPKSELSLNCG